MADATLAQNTAKAEGRGDRAFSSIWNKMLLVGGLAMAVSFSACASRAIYSSEGIITTLLKQSGNKNSLLHIGESRVEKGYEITLNEILPPYDDIPPSAVIQISHRLGDERSLIQIGFKEGETKRIRSLDRTILEISIHNIRAVPNTSECSANFTARTFKSE